MAKRKRKMTLFDVINTGQPVGLQHRQRVPTYQPTPELPVKKKLAKLFGRKSPGDLDRPLTAAEQLEKLRRELVGPDGPAKARVAQPEAARVYEAIKEEEPEVVPVEAVDRSVMSERPARSRVAELAEAAEISERRASPQRVPRRSVGTVLRDAWMRVEPRFAAVRAAIAERGGAATSRGVASSRILLERARELGGRYGVTAAAAAAMVVVLCGAFYAGRMLFTRPVVPIAGNDLVASGNARPDVLNIDGPDTARANEPIANVSNNATQAKLEKKSDAKSDPQPAPTGVFGGRRPDLNYVIVQSYYVEAEADAAVEVLAKYGVRAGVERNLPRWGDTAVKTIYSVVSLDSFAKIRDDPVYQAFIKKIATISDKEKGTTLPGRLDPAPYRYTPATPK